MAVALAATVKAISGLWAWNQLLRARSPLANDAALIARARVES